MKYIYKITILFLLILFSTKFALPNDIYKGEYFQNSILNAFNTGLNYYLPPGSWEVSDIEDVGINLDYKNVSLWSNENEYMKISIPLSKTPAGYRWRAGGLKKCDGVKKKNIYTFAVERGRIEGALCVSKWKDDDSGDEWVMVDVNMRTTSGELKWTVQSFATDYDFLNQEISERDRKKIAEQALDRFLDGFKGKSPSGASIMMSFFN